MTKFLPVNSERWVAFNGGVPYREDGVHVGEPWRPREETEEELAAIAKREGEPAPFGHIRPPSTELAPDAWLYPIRLSNADSAKRKAKNKRRAAARFRARELRREIGASALAPAVLPALAAGLGPASPEPEADLMAAIRDSAHASKVSG